jgi:hypothetical protein
MAKVNIQHLDRFLESEQGKLSKLKKLKGNKKKKPDIYKSRTDDGYDK